VAVIGGSGLVRTKMVKDSGYRDRRGLVEALTGAEVVVDVSNFPSLEDAAVLAFFENSGRSEVRDQKSEVRGQKSGKQL
jgi:hypothetical protein